MKYRDKNGYGGWGNGRRSERRKTDCDILRQTVNFYIDRYWKRYTVKAMRDISLLEKNELRSRLQFALVLALFFPVILNAALKGTIGNLSPEIITLKWGLVIVVMVMCYFFIEFLDRVVSTPVLITINVLIFIEIGMFAGLLYYMAAFLFGSITFPILLALSVIGVWFVPIVLLCALAANEVLVLYFDLKSDASKVWDRWKFK